MSLIARRYPGWAVVMVLSLCILWLGHKSRDRGFNCRAQLGTEPSLSQCGSRNLLDLFIAMNGDGEGYLLLSGKIGCRGESEIVNDILDFNYEKKGGNYDLHLRKHNTLLNNLLPQLRRDDLMIKISPLDQRRFLLSSGKNALLVCKSE